MATMAICKVALNLALGFLSVVKTRVGRKGSLKTVLAKYISRKEF